MKPEHPDFVASATVVIVASFVGGYRLLMKRQPGAAFSVLCFHVVALLDGFRYASASEPSDSMKSLHAKCAMFTRAVGLPVLASTHAYDLSTDFQENVYSKFFAPLIIFGVLFVYAGVGAFGLNAKVYMPTVESVSMLVCCLVGVCYLSKGYRFEGLRVIVTGGTLVLAAFVGTSPELLFGIKCYHITQLLHLVHIYAVTTSLKMSESVVYDMIRKKRESQVRIRERMDAANKQE